jgi:hypothetical protein
VRGDKCVGGTGKGELPAAVAPVVKTEKIVGHQKVEILLCEVRLVELKLAGCGRLY